MTRFLEHTTAALAAMLMMAVTFNAVIAVPATEPASIAAPVLA